MVALRFDDIVRQACNETVIVSCYRELRRCGAEPPFERKYPMTIENEQPETLSEKPEIVVNRGISKSSAAFEGMGFAQGESARQENVQGQEEEDEDIIAYPAYGVRRKGVEYIIEFRSEGQHYSAISYGYLMEVSFSPQAGLSLLFTNHRVTVEGRNLLKIYKHLMKQEVSYVQQGPDSGGETEIVVSAIKVERL